MEHLEFPTQVFVYLSLLEKENESQSSMTIKIDRIKASSFDDIVDYYEENKDQTITFADPKLNEHFGIKTQN
jgi:hypothetical protein